MLIDHPIPALQDNYIWLLHQDQAPHTIIVDPGEAAPVFAALEQFDLLPTAIFLTHHHWDHTDGVAELLQAFDIPVYGPAREALHLVTHPLRAGDHVVLEQPQVVFEILDIPGHTLGHIAFYGEQRLYCGDTLFAAGCGRAFEGTLLQLYHSLMQLNALPETTQIHCAHEYTLGNLAFAQHIEPDNQAIAQRIEAVKAIRAQNRPSLPSNFQLERATNPFLRVSEDSVIAQVQQFSGEAINTPEAVFAYLRQSKDCF